MKRKRKQSDNPPIFQLHELFPDEKISTYRLGTAVARGVDRRSERTKAQVRIIWNAMRGAESSYKNFPVFRRFHTVVQIGRFPAVRNLLGVDSLSLSALFARLEGMYEYGFLLRMYNHGIRDGVGYATIPASWPTQFQLALEILRIINTTPCTSDDLNYILASSKDSSYGVAYAFSKTATYKCGLLVPIIGILYRAGFIRFDGKHFLTSDGFLELSKYENNIWSEDATAKRKAEKEKLSEQSSNENAQAAQ